MGNFFSNMWSKLFSENSNFKIVILGLANAGKTTLLKLGSVVQSHPTIGSNYEEVQHNNVALQTWDVGGQESLRRIWDCYYKGANGIVFIIDSSDRDSWEIAKQELGNLFNNEEIKDSIFLILANKQDLENAAKASEIIKFFGLEDVTENDWMVYGISVKNGDGVEEAFDNLVDKLQKKTQKKSPQLKILKILKKCYFCHSVFKLQKNINFVL